MPAHLEGIREAMVAFVRHLDRAGLRASVPTAPEWRTRKLVAHQGTVHRWATAHLRGTPIDLARTEAEAMNADDPVEWFREGSLALVQALMAPVVPADALVFLADAGAPREFWARRQCHETTVHSVDALAAALGRVPTAADAAWITEDVALDGIDEFLTGFVPRPQSRVRSGQAYRLGVTAGGRGWVVQIGPDAPVTTRTTDPAADVLVAGEPVSTYLSLWNRSAEVGAEDERWRTFLSDSAVAWISRT